MLDQAPNLLLREAQEIQVNGTTTTSTPRIHALTLLWRLGSTLWCDVIAARRNCLWNWFLVDCFPAGPVAYAWFARWVYCLISLMMVASWLKEQCFAGISSCICSPNGSFCFVSRKRHLAAIGDANRYGKLPRLVEQVSDQLPGEVCILCEILYVSLMSNGLQERGACYFSEDWIGPHVLVRMEARSIKSKQFGLLSRPALLKFEVYHGSMSERV